MFIYGIKCKSLGHVSRLVFSSSEADAVEKYTTAVLSGSDYGLIVGLKNDDLELVCFGNTDELEIYSSESLRDFPFLADFVDNLGKEKANVQS